MQIAVYLKTVVVASLSLWLIL